MNENLSAYDDILGDIKITTSKPKASFNKDFRLPVNGLPSQFVAFCKHVAERRNVPLEVPLMGALTAAGAVVGAHVKSRIAGLENRAGLLTMIVAPSASGKSQPLRDIMTPLFELDRKLLAGYKTDIETWRTANARKSNPDPKPQKKQFICDTATDAARMEFVCDNPRGGIMYRDELRAYFKSLTGRYNEQAVEHALEIADFNPVKIHTKGEDTIKVADHSFLAVLGGIQNDVLQDTIRPDFIANGLLQRFCAVVFETDGFPKIGDGIEPDYTVWWSRTVESLRSLGNIVWEYRPSTDAAEAYRQEYEKFCANYVPSPENGDRYNNYKHMAYAKSLFAVHRLCLIAHMLKIVAIAPQYPHKHPDIDAETIKWAFSCVPYIVSQKMKVYEMICGIPKPRTDRDIIRELNDMVLRKGKTLNQSALAEATGIARPNINQYLKN